MNGMKNRRRKNENINRKTIGVVFKYTNSYSPSPPTTTAIIIATIAKL